MRTLASINSAYECLPMLDHLRRHANFVPGEGSSQAPVTVIGEAPGKIEDEQRRPFVGPSGRWLVAELEGIGLPRPTLYLTNVVKYRPPGNRTPLPFELLESEPLVREELITVGSPLILACGRTALNLFRLGSIGELHGQFFPFGGGGDQLVLPLYHPSACLRDDDVARLTHQDLYVVKELIT